MKHLILAFILTIIALPAFAADKETAFDRIIKTGTIRCGYYVFPPMVYRDPNTNELSGFAVDMMNALAKDAGLKVEWTEEINFANWVSALQSKRFDVACAPSWPDIALSKVVRFSTPLLYAGLSPMVRADDARFKGDDLARLNQPDVTFVTQEGNAQDTLTREVFDKAKISAMPTTMDGPTVLQEIVTKKADAILLDRNAEIAYNKNNTVKLRLVAPDRPVKAQPFALAVAKSEADLQDFLNDAVEAMLNDGRIDRIMKKWEPEPGTFLRPTKPYEVKK